MHPSSDDGFKWFGEGFEGFPKQLPDDTVEYTVHVVGPNITDSVQREKLRQIQSAGIDIVKTLLKGFIWQREPFQLTLVRKDGLNFLHGRTNYADSVEDEWLIVYILRELSRKFSEAWIRVTDTDGEFLLVEAANVLPKWLNPEVADNRVWFNCGDLLIITPLNHKSPSASPLSFKGSLEYISSVSRSSLLHSRLVQEEAFYRLRNYPQQIEDNLHHALISIPRRLAFVLHSNKAYISPAVEAFYLRDPIALKPLQNPKVGTLLFEPRDLVTARVKFTKVGYAQLRSQVFAPPGLWARSLSPNSGSIIRKRQEIGMKVACGMEMLVLDPANIDRKVVREIKMLLEDLDTGEEKLPSDKEVKSWGTEEDDDSWLDIDFNDLESELLGKRGSTKSNSTRTGEFGDRNAQENLRKIVQRFEEFINEDDAEDLDDEDDDEGEGSDSSAASDELGSDDAEDKDASFDEDEFTAMMREMMGMPKEVMQEIMGPDAAKARGVAKSDGGVNAEIMQMGRKLVFGPERPPESNSPGASAPKNPPFGQERSLSSLISDDTSTMASTGSTKWSNEPRNLPYKGSIEETPRAHNIDSDSDEETIIRNLSNAFEKELKKAGALSLDGFTNLSGKGKEVDKGAKPSDPLDVSKDQHEDEDGILDEDFNLVSNILESFKSQSGLSGPGGNMLSMMGVKLPRDDGDEEQADNKNNSR